MQLHACKKQSVRQACATPNVSNNFHDVQAHGKRHGAEHLTRQQGTNLNNHQTTSHMHNAKRLRNQQRPLASLQHTSMFSYQFSALNDQNVTVQETSLLTR